MNLTETITFNTEKPSVSYIKKTEKIKYFAVGLGKNTVLKKHTAPVPATLLALKGKVNFLIEGKTLEFKPFDTFEIPLGVEHEVVGLEDENLFTVTMEL